MRRLFASEKQSQSDTETFEDSMSHILRRSASSSPPPVNPKEEKNASDKAAKHKRSISSFDHAPSHHSFYQKTVLGVGPSTKTERPRDINVHIKLKRPSLANFQKLLQKLLRAHKKRLVIALGCFVILFGAITGFKALTKQDQGNVAGISQIAPKTVFLPKPVPEGFTVGSSKQELENGAILYTIYGPNGEEITVNQQLSVPEFDQSVLANGFKFTTPHGTAYVLEEGRLVTGYLLAEDTWVLLNNTDGLLPEDMRTLIRSLEPI